MMKHPPHPGLALKDEIDAIESTMSLAKVAEALGVTLQQLHRVLTGTCSISPEMAVRLELSGIGKAEHWQRLQGNLDLAQVRSRASSFKVQSLVPKVA